MRPVWFAVGIVALGAGLVGVVLPVLPTAPFLIVAAFAFARSSERWNRWLRQHSVFGPPIRNWEEHGAIGRTAKILAALSMAGSVVLSFLLGVAPVLLAVHAVVLAAAALFVLTRPSPPLG
jgi:uncharacterized membrane protein YbaN (DUF454 family)